jgi:perosamine synthetase
MKIDFPVNSFEVTQKDIEKVVEVLKEGLISGDTRVVREFEDKFASFLEVENAIAVNNGSSALDLAFTLAELNPGDEVILPSFTIASCLFPILRSGATPIFVDCDLETWQMNISEVKEKVTKKTRVILAVHTYGLAVEVSSLLDLCKDKNILLIEDCAEAHGLKYNGKFCGSYGDIATFSFYANKLVTTGEGGMLIIRDTELANKARKIRNLSFNSGRRFIHDELGWNYRLSSIQAALGISQIDRIEKYLLNRSKAAEKYRKNLSSLPGLKWQALENKGSRNIFWVNGVLFQSSIYGNAQEVSIELSKAGIETRPFFYPLHLQPLLNKYNLVPSSLPITEYISSQGVYLPGGNTLSLESVDLICDRIISCFTNKQ